MEKAEFQHYIPSVPTHSLTLHEFTPSAQLLPAGVLYSYVTSYPFD